MTETTNTWKRLHHSSLHARNSSEGSLGLVRDMYNNDDPSGSTKVLSKEQHFEDDFPEDEKEDQQLKEADEIDEAFAKCAAEEDDFPADEMEEISLNKIDDLPDSNIGKGKKVKNQLEGPSTEDVYEELRHANTETSKKDSYSQKAVHVVTPESLLSSTKSLADTLTVVDDASLETNPSVLKDMFGIKSNRRVRFGQSAKKPKEIVEEDEKNYVDDETEIDDFNYDVSSKKTKEDFSVWREVQEVLFDCTYLIRCLAQEVQEGGCCGGASNKESKEDISTDNAETYNDGQKETEPVACSQ